MAAGQGKRMHSARPKVLHPLAGRPLVAHVLDAARRSRRARSCSSSATAATSSDARSRHPISRSSRRVRNAGTGDAVRLALAALPEDGVTLVINGDCPLIPAATYAALGRTSRRPGSSWC